MSSRNVTWVRSCKAWVEQAEILLHLTKIGQQIARQLHELLKPVLERRVVQQRHFALLHVGDLSSCASVPSHAMVFSVAGTAVATPPSPGAIIR
jgi:hypothetical protein